MPKKIRVYELAHELGLTNKEALDLCLSLGMGVKSHSSSIEDAQADRARRKADREGLRRPVQPEEPAAPAKKAAATKKAAAKKAAEPMVEGEPRPDLIRSDAPAAATTSGQRVLVSTLGHVAVDAVAEGIEAPAIVVIGDIVKVREELAAAASAEPSR